MEAALAERRTGRMSGPEFRAFQARRPDHERWELLGGIAMMMTPPTLTHNQIATNLQRLLDDALERRASLLAAQRPGLGSGDYKPEPSGVFGNAQKRTRIPEADLSFLLRQID